MLNTPTFPAGFSGELGKIFFSSLSEVQLCFSEGKDHFTPTVSAPHRRKGTPWAMVGQESVESGHPGMGSSAHSTQQSSGQPKGAGGAAPSPQGVSLQAVAGCCTSH